MFEYVFENKEWIFSGIGVFLLAGAFGIVRYILQNKKKGKASEINQTSRNQIIGKKGINVIDTDNLTPEKI